MKKGIVLGLAATMLVGVFAGCGPTDKNVNSENSVPISSGNGTTGTANMVFADTQSPTNLDPAISWNSWYTSRYGITETLYKLDDNLEAQPWLAQSCESVDNTTWKITLRDDVTFQNGNKMTAQSVIDSWNRTIELNARLDELLFIDSMTADGQALTVKTTKPVPSFISGLCEPLAGIIDVHSDTNPETNPIGTGPFIAKSYEVKKQCQVERYDNYWGGKPKLESATFNIIADASALAMAQQTGETNVSVTIPSTSLSLFEDTSKYTVDGVAGSRGQVIFMNQKNSFLQDVNVRKALSMCVDKKSYAEVLNKGASVATNGLYPDFMAFGGKDAKGYSYDTAAAKKLLEDAGYTDTNGDGILEKDGKPISLRLFTYPTKAELPMFSEAMADAAKAAGMQVEVLSESWDALVDRQKTKDFDMMLVSFTMCPTGDPQYFADIAFKTGGSSNYGNYSNPEVDTLIDKLDQEFDKEARYTLAKEIQQKILDDAGFIVIGHAKFINVMDANVKGCKTNPSEYYLLNAETTME